MSLKASANGHQKLNCYYYVIIFYFWCGIAVYVVR